MIKKSIFVLLIALLFTACAERGAMIPAKLTENHIKKYLSKDEHIPTLIVRNSREDSLGKNISGTVILIIGLVLLL